LSEAKDTLLKLDGDFPFEKIENLKIPTENKIEVVAAIQDIVSKNQSSISKLQGELDSQVKTNEDLSTKVPKTEEHKVQSGAETVMSKMSEFGLDPTKFGLQSKEPSASDQLIDAISKLAAAKKGDN